jgi:hypothetical protein
MLLAQFSGADTLREAARNTHQADLRAIDAFTPFAIEGLIELLPARPSMVRVVMFFGGIGVAALAYATEWWTAVIEYPINSGGRPLHSWPAFMLFPFAIGIFGAAVSGLIALFAETGLPRLHHRLFSLPGFERVSQDAFLLALEPPPTETERQRAHAWLKQAGATAIWEIET